MVSFYIIGQTRIILGFAGHTVLSQLLYCASKVTVDSGRKWLTFVLILCPVALLVPAACPTLTSQWGLVLWPDCSWQSRISSLWTLGMSTIWIYFFPCWQSDSSKRNSFSWPSICHSDFQPWRWPPQLGTRPSASSEVVPMFPSRFSTSLCFLPCHLLPPTFLFCGLHPFKLLSPSSTVFT